MRIRGYVLSPVDRIDTYGHVCVYTHECLRACLHGSCSLCIQMSVFRVIIVFLRQLSCRNDNRCCIRHIDGLPGRLRHSSIYNNRIRYVTRANI